jgi:hypothetical protein
VTAVLTALMVMCQVSEAVDRLALHLSEHGHGDRVRDADGAVSGQVPDRLEVDASLAKLVQECRRSWKWTRATLVRVMSASQVRLMFWVEQLASTGGSGEYLARGMRP